MPIIDTHAHIDQIENWPQALERARQAQVSDIVAVSLNLESMHKILDLAKISKDVHIHPALGIHPEMVQKEAHEYVALIRNAGFTVADNDIKTSTPWWSRVDCGILEKLKIASYHPGITEVITVAKKP